MKVLSQWIDMHHMGSHCASTAMRTIFLGYGYVFSEDLCFGLGSGLGFTYQKYQSVDYYFFTGRNDSLEENAVGILGGYIETKRTDDPVVGWQWAKQWIDLGVPVILDLDMMYLPYMRDKLQIEQSFHFGLHNAILVGYDEEKSVAFLLDYLWNDVIEVSLKDLENARNSKTSPIKPDNGLKAIVLPNRKRDINLVINEAIRTNIFRMKRPFAFKMGLPGIKLFAREIRMWKKMLPENERQTHAYMASMLFEKVGTGGGNFRRMYARYLKECATLTGNQEYLNSYKHYMELFRCWRQLAKLFELGAIDPNAGIFADDPEIEMFLEKMVDLEYKALENLEAIISVEEVMTC
ncbi:BtrH N-terminal domain-containing protein [Lysinibacillus sp. NPDC093712]|uniref:BtrH N-terminal domain-containing protein n=1 Tax=Lysinibacillus sp. NPDC093712 TaxID=3390579 RepID=UPI003D034C4B